MKDAPGGQGRDRPRRGKPCQIRRIPAYGDEKARVLLAERTRSRQEPVPAAGCGRGARLMAETTPRVLSVEAARAYPRRWPVALAFAAGLQGRCARRSEGTSR